MQSWLSIVVIVVIAGLAVWRWNSVTRVRLGDRACEEWAGELISALFEHASAPDAPVRIKASFWQASDLSSYEAIELCRWMIGHGLVNAGEWGLLAIVLGNPPDRLALTRKSWERSMNRPQSVVIQTEGGPVNYGSGTQVVAGGDVTIGLSEIAAAIRQDALELHGTAAVEALDAAEFLEEVAERPDNADRERVNSVLTWLRDRVNEAIGAGAGAGAWAATAVVLSQWFR